MLQLKYILLFFASLFLTACFHSDNAAGGGGGGPVGTLALQAEDAPTVTPCPTQDSLTTAILLQEFVDALKGGTLSYLDVPFDGADADIYKKKCGLEGFWDPADNVDELTLASIGLDPSKVPTITNLILFGNAGICAKDFNNASFGVGEGFPVSGTYRNEIKTAHMGKTYHLRFRSIVTGSSVGNTFTSEGITPATDLATLVYSVDGTTTAHDDLFVAITDTLQASADDAPGATIRVRKTAGGPVIFKVVLELICVSVS